MRDSGSERIAAGCGAGTEILLSEWYACAHEGVMLVRGYELLCF